MVRVMLFCVFAPLLVVLIQLIGPYEDAGDAGAGQLPIKVIKLDENGRPYVSWCCRPEDRVINHDRYVLALRNGHGVVESGDSRSKYSLETVGANDITVELHNSGEIFVYEVRGAQLFPVKRKVLNAWKVIVALIGSALMVSLATRLVHKIRGESQPREIDGVRLD